MPPENAGPQPIVIHAPVQGEAESAVAVETEPASAISPSGLAVLGTLPLIEDAKPAKPADAPTVAPAKPRRALSLDALRGLFLILMTLGFATNFGGFPLWMYHRQMPPPTYAVVDVAGISWRDLAYGAFLFTMAAALPLTLSRRIAKGETEIGIIFAALKRYALLLVFALLVGHANTYFLGYTQTTRAIAIGGFFVMAMVFTRRREDWSEERYRLINRAGWGLAILFLALTPLLYGKRFSFERHDDIITGLAFASFAGSVVWYFTRASLTARLGVLAAAVALYLGARADGWIQSWWYDSPAEWAFSPSMLVLLAVVIPGTIAGDVMLRWMRSAEPSGLAAWNRTRAIVLATLSAALTPLVVVGLYNRAVDLTAQLVLAIAVFGAFLVARPATATERMLRSLFGWSMIWLVLGLVLEPFEGGIKKVPDTLSYFFTVAGLTTALLTSLAAGIEVFRAKKALSPLIDVGHNPLLAYVLFTVLINSALELIPATQGLLTSSPGAALLRAVLATVAVVLIVRVFSKRRIYWRA